MKRSLVVVLILALIAIFAFASLTNNSGKSTEKKFEKKENKTEPKKEHKRSCIFS